MNAYRRRHILCGILAAWLALVTPTSGQAFLTELVVGGSLLVEVGSTVVAALPQVALFATSLLTLAQSSEEIADTVKNIIGMFFPGSSKKKKAAPAATPAPAPSPAPVVATPADEPAAEAPTDEAVASRVGDLVDAIVLGFTRQMALLAQLKELPEGSPERDALGAGYSDLVSEQAGLVDGCVTMVLDAVEAGNESLVTAFDAAVRGLDPQQRIALAPVLAKVVSQGSRFAKLHGGTGADLFARLTELQAQIGG